MDEMRIAKYETLIEDINDAIKKQDSFTGLLGAVKRMAIWSSENKTSPLDMIFEQDKLNEYASVICRKAEFRLRGTEDNIYTDPWESKYGNKRLVDAKIKIEAAKDFVKFCRVENNRAEAYKFIFWALMILTVQKDAYDENLSLICDFARMLRLTDDELMDIAYTIKCIYNEIETEYSFKSDMVPLVLGNLFNLYGDTDTRIGDVYGRKNSKIEVD